MPKARLIVILFLTLACASAALAQPATTCSNLNAGYLYMKFGSMNVGVWYPTVAAATSYVYNPIISGSVAFNGPVASCGAKWPLLLFSHGFNGCGTQSVEITEEMARHGYIIAAPDHADATCSVASQTSLPPNTPDPSATFKEASTWTDQTYLNRYVDDENTINGMLADAKFGPAIDSSKIGAFAHSLGGYDVFGLLGGWDSWYDPRVVAAGLLSPEIDTYLAQNRIPFGKGPKMFQGGTLDTGITPDVSKPGGSYDQAVQSKLFAELPAAGHLVWTNFACNGTTSSPATVQNCIATVPNVATINTYLFAFFDNWLVSKPANILFQPGVGLADYRRNSQTYTFSGASWDRTYPPLTPNGFSALFVQGGGLAPAPVAAVNLVSPPTTLGGLTATVTDAAGTARSAQLYYVSSTQVNFVIPAGTVSGTATVAAFVAGTQVASGTITVAAVAPSIFTANGSGSGTFNGYAQVNNGIIPQYVAIFDSSLNPIPLDVSSGNVYLVIAGTGIRGASSATVTVGGLPVPVAGIASYGVYAGVDVVSVGPLPTSLKGTVNITLAAGGLNANVTTVTIK